MGLPCVVGRGGTRASISSLRCSADVGTPYSPPVSVAILRQMKTSAWRETMEQRNLSRCSDATVVRMSPGSHELRLAESSTTSRLVKLGTECSDSRASSSTFCSEASPEPQLRPPSSPS